MEKVRLFFVFLLVLLLTVQGSSDHHHHHHRHHHRHRHALFQKLFVFGDSYADTGNTWKFISKSWKVPYGITFPGKPTGRFSNGRVLTDYLASFIGIRSPLPYRWKNIGPKPLRYGMNFAYGGTGVFDTMVPFPNMTTQIDLFQQLIEQGVYTKRDLKHSMAHVSVAGNDYITYLARNGSMSGILDFIESLVNQLRLDVKRIMDIGVKKISVTGLEPVGCLPDITEPSSHKQCIDMYNTAAGVHNSLLKSAVVELNQNASRPTVVILDLYKAFMSILQSSENQAKWKFENVLMPCCKGVKNGYSCGNVDENGTKMYTVCERPDSAFFWDGVHPTQMGWAIVSSYLKTTLYQLSS
ncbi:GDSL esterase/lipase At5g03610-like [Magnolia sinica]|uniref:GDSL esterase/lipase At5g03610-like n=1 Tax=Magnolia sinica TaxID=86752 RepID=UPI0026580C3D|nr:GDSL esterase/lipase At5g03610-like [Magnolia sinica]